MKKKCLCITALLSLVMVLSSCGSSKDATNVNDIAFRMANGYSAKTDSCMNGKMIATEKEFKKYFSENASQDRTVIDFDKECVIAFLYPTTEERVNILPGNVRVKDSDSIFVHSAINYSKKKTAAHRPMLLYVIDRKYKDKGVLPTFLRKTLSDAPSLTPYFQERNRLLIK